MIILDEPTNHLDIDSREALSDALNAYTGAVLLITHDAHLAQAVADRLWLVKDGSVSPFEGDLDDYRRLVLEANKSPSERNGPARPDTKSLRRQEAAAAREAISPLKKQAAAVEQKIEQLNSVLDRLDTELARPELYEEAKIDRLTKLNKERAALLNAIEDAERKWLDTMEQLEAANATLEETA